MNGLDKRFNAQPALAFKDNLCFLRAFPNPKSQISHLLIDTKVFCGNFLGYIRFAAICAVHVGSVVARSM
jgi:hypothetical protein